MGVLRILLAISVVIWHSGPLFGLELMGGRVAVQTFFIISGFYMSLILNEKYTGKGSYKIFITNRFMRIYCAYLPILALTVLYSVYEYHNPYHIQFPSEINGFNFAKYGHTLSLTTWLYVIISNLVIFGQDAAIFMGLDTDNGLLYFTSNFREISPSMIAFLLVPQAWTLSLELMFYLLAPFLLRKRPCLVLSLIACGFILRLVIYYAVGWIHLPWTESFFPCELPLFLFGNISYAVFLFIKRENVARPVLLAFGISFLAATFGYQFLPVHPATKWFYYAAAIVSIPCLFRFFQKSRVDRYIGELSYPLYLSHILMTHIVRAFMFKHDLWKYTSLVIVLASIVSAIILIECVVKPVDRYRQARIFKRLEEEARAASS